jgi:hypothetical protein
VSSGVATIERERELFERWVKDDLPKLWPNPGIDGRHHAGGAYNNARLQDMWCAWQAARIPTCAGCGTRFEQCATYWPEQKKCCPDCKCIGPIPTKERAGILARFIRNQVSLADRPPPGCIQLNNEEATVCAIALELLCRD